MNSHQLIIFTGTSGVDNTLYIQVILSIKNIIIIRLFQSYRSIVKHFKLQQQQKSNSWYSGLVWQCYIKLMQQQDAWNRTMLHYSCLQILPQNCLAILFIHLQCMLWLLMHLLTFNNNMYQCIIIIMHVAKRESTNITIIIIIQKRK